MAGSEKSVKVVLTADTTRYRKDMGDAAQATSKLSRDMGSVDAKAKGMGNSVGGASGALKGMAVAGAAVAGTALVSFLGDAVSAAGDLEQSVGGVDAVFKENAQTIHDFGKNAVDAVGLTRNEFNELSTVMGALLKNSGVEDYTKATINLTQRAADVSAMFGGSAKEAVEAFSSALKGEYNPIERYGVKLNETAVNTSLASKGLDKLTGAALDQAKAQERINIIMAQTSDAAGKFASEADTMQGQQQRLTKSWEEAKAELGQALLPAITKTMEALRGGVDIVVAASRAWEQIPGPIQAAVGALMAYRIAQGPLSKGADHIKDRLVALRQEMALQKALSGGITGGYQRLGDEMQAAGKKTGALRAGLAATSRSMGGLRGAGSALFGLVGGPWGLAIAGLTAVIGKWVSANAEAEQRQQELTDAIKADSGVVGENTRAKVVNRLESEGILKVAKELGVNLADVTEAALGNEEAQKRVNAQLEVSKRLMAESAAGSINGGEAIADWQGKADSLTGALGGQNEELKNSIDAYKRTTEAAGATADATKETGDAAQQAAPQVDRYAKTLTKIKDEAQKAKDLHKELATAILEVKAAAGDADAAEIAYQQSLDDAQERIKKRIELQKQLKEAGGKSARTSELEKDLSGEKDAKKRAKLQEQLAKSRAADAKSATDEQRRLREELENFTATLDTNTQAGRDNLTALMNIGTQANSMAEANLKNGESVKDVNKELDSARQNLIDTAKGMGASQKAAEDMAGRYVLTRDQVDALKTSLDKIPKEKVTELKVKDDQAKRHLAELQTIMSGDWLKDKTVRITTIYEELGSTAARTAAYSRDPRRGSVIEGYADGGHILGPGTGTSDSIPAWLSNGEYVIKAAAVAKYGAAFFHQLNTMRFADGGYVSRGGLPAPQPVPVAAVPSPSLTVQMSSPDPYQAAREVLAEWEWRSSHG